MTLLMIWIWDTRLRNACAPITLPRYYDGITGGHPVRLSVGRGHPKTRKARAHALRTPASLTGARSSLLVRGCGRRRVQAKTGAGPRVRVEDAETEDNRREQRALGPAQPATRPGRGHGKRCRGQYGSAWRSRLGVLLRLDVYDGRRAAPDSLIGAGGFPRAASGADSSKHDVWLASRVLRPCAPAVIDH